MMIMRFHHGLSHVVCFYNVHSAACISECCSAIGWVCAWWMVSVEECA